MAGQTNDSAILQIIGEPMMSTGNQQLLQSQRARLDIDVRRVERAIQDAAREIDEAHEGLGKSLDYLSSQVYGINGGYDASTHIDRVRDRLKSFSVELVLRCTRMDAKWGNIRQSASRAALVTPEERSAIHAAREKKGLSGFAKDEKMEQADSSTMQMAGAVAIKKEPTFVEPPPFERDSAPQSVPGKNTVAMATAAGVLPEELRAHQARAEREISRDRCLFENRKEVVRSLSASAKRRADRTPPRGGSRGVKDDKRAKQDSKGSQRPWNPKAGRRVQSMDSYDSSVDYSSSDSEEVNVQNSASTRGRTPTRGVKLTANVQTRLLPVSRLGVLGRAD